MDISGAIRGVWQRDVGQFNNFYSSESVLIFQLAAAARTGCLGELFGKNWFLIFILSKG